MADKDMLEFVQSSKNIIDEVSEDENEVNNAVPDPTSSPQSDHHIKMTIGDQFRALELRCMENKEPVQLPTASLDHGSKFRGLSRNFEIPY
ncbi:hypothetical protein TNCV_5008591 [Trichonephila clavipes]|nr:hypothetical protein TNCV_5008591 [Trichonephila clavipes]